MADGKVKDDDRQQRDGVADRQATPIPRKRLPQGNSRSIPQYDFSDLKGAPRRAAVLKYLDKGWRLLPVAASTGEVLLPEGVGGASCDASTVLEWIEDPDIEIGVATGRESGIVALRYRRKLLRPDALRALLVGHEPLRTLENRGIDGRCFLFTAPAEVLPSRQLVPQIDFLAEGGYFIPSQSSWSTEHKRLDSLPEWLLPKVVGIPTVSSIDRAVAGDLQALNRATKYQAAQAYSALGWKLVPVAEVWRCDAEPGQFFPPELWRDEPTTGLGFRTGVASGVVGVCFGNYTPLNALEAKHGQLPYPMISGKHPVLCFRAPQEAFASKKVAKDTWYIGEGDFLPAPPSTIEGVKLDWEVGLGSPPELPELPLWLLDLVSAPVGTGAVTRTRPKVTRQASQGSGVTPPPKKLGDFALDYAARGMSVFPVHPDSLEPLFPKKGHRDATTDPATISRWWKKTPHANIGVATGAASGTVVLVADAQSGLQTLEGLEVQHGQLETLRAKAPSGDLHLFFEAPEQMVGNSTGFLPGLDLRGDGGYVVGPPSLVGGEKYIWVDRTAKAELPGWLLDLVTGQALASLVAPVGEATIVDSPEWWAKQLDAWLAERCDLGEGFSAKASVLREDFSAWLGRGVTAQRLGRLLNGKGFESRKSSVFLYFGLRLRESASSGVP